MNEWPLMIFFVTGVILIESKVSKKANEPFNLTERCCAHDKAMGFVEQMARDSNRKLPFARALFKSGARMAGKSIYLCRCFSTETTSLSEWPLAASKTR
jgi:hypothetical protein